MQIKCANVRPNQFTQLISGNIASWKCPGCVLFWELPFCNLDSEELASEIENDGNDLLEFGQNFACRDYANQDDILNPLGESQASANNDLIAERNKFNREVLMCHLNINSIQNKFEEVSSLIKKLSANLKLTPPILTLNLPSLVMGSTRMIGRYSSLRIF